MELNGKENTYISWDYPEIYDRSKQNWIEISLSHTRASDSIRIKYDSERNGYSIEQERLIEIASGCESTDDWKEVAFIPSWQRTEPEVVK